MIHSYVRYRTYKVLTTAYTKSYANRRWDGCLKFNLPWVPECLLLPPPPYDGTFNRSPKEPLACHPA